MVVTNEVSSAGIAKVVSLEELLDMNLDIPSYQRAYKWTVRSVNLLINDLKEIGEDAYCKEYRLGTIIVAANNEKLEIVDGQQRVVTLVLLLKALHSVGDYRNFKIPQGIERGEYLSNEVTQKSIIRNYNLILSRIRKMRFRDKKLIEPMFKAVDKLSFVFVRVDNIAEAFQIFDSQNYRGRKLNPHDLLKAFHLRCMSDEKSVSNEDKMRSKELTVVNWEKRNQKEIHRLFDKYLHRIYRWKLRLPAGSFTEHDLDEFKGIESQWGFSYGKRAEKAEENFQIGQAFIAGRAFFSFVKHYEDLKDELCAYLEEEVKKLFENDKNGGDKIIFKEVMGWIGFRHAWNLFECVCLSFVDKFSLETFKGNYEYFAHLLEWAMIIRVRKQRVSFAGINKYVLGLDEGINVDNMFAVIDQARLPSEILERALPLDEKTLTRNKADPKDYPQGIQQGSSKDNWDRLKNILIALN